MNLSLTERGARNVAAGRIDTSSTLDDGRQMLFFYAEVYGKLKPRNNWSNKYSSFPEKKQKR
jgi:hypothetical protein